MKFVLSPNPEPPFNLVRHSMPYGSLSFPDATEDEMISTVIARLRTVGVLPDKYWLVDENELPGGSVSGANDELFFFRAWYWDEGCKVDMDKARKIHLGNIRTQRDVQLQDLDVEYLRAMETGDRSAQVRIATLKQELRDIPQDLDLTRDVNTPEELYAVWPKILARPVPSE